MENTQVYCPQCKGEAGVDGHKTDLQGWRCKDDDCALQFCIIDNIYEVRREYLKKKGKQ